MVFLLSQQVHIGVFFHIQMNIKCNLEILLNIHGVHFNTYDPHALTHASHTSHTHTHSETQISLNKSINATVNIFIFHFFYIFISIDFDFRESFSRINIQYFTNTQYFGVFWGFFSFVFLNQVIIMLLKSYVSEHVQTQQDYPTKFKSFKFAFSCKRPIKTN